MSIDDDTCWWFIKDLNNLVSFDAASALYCFRDHVDLTSGNDWCCDESAVLGTDHVQVAFGNLGTFFSDFQFALNALDSGDGLRWEAFLEIKIYFNNFAALMIKLIIYLFV